LVSSKILLITEGQKTEPKIIENLITKYFDDYGRSSIHILSYKTHVYALYNQLKKDDFETNIMDVLREKNSDAYKDLADVDFDDIAYTYLFFDYDGHAYDELKRDNIIEEMIDYFDNETDNGKLFISYPMVEALKDVTKINVCSRRCTFQIEEGPTYKGQVHRDCEFERVENYDDKTWMFLSRVAVKKSNCIVSDEYILPEYAVFLNDNTQLNIFRNQVIKFITTDSKVAVLSTFPHFLINHFGNKMYSNVVVSNADDIMYKANKCSDENCYMNKRK